MKKYLLILSSALYSFSSFAEGDKEQQLAKIQAGLQQKSELRMNFKQTVYTQLRKKKRSSKGYAYFKKPAKFRWAIETPLPNHLIFDGENFAEINPVAKTGTVYQNSSGELKKYAELVSIVMDIEKLLGRFKIADLIDNSKEATVILSPKANEGVSTVELKISHAKKYISSVKIEYHGGNYWFVEFAEPNSEKLPEDAFTIPTDKSYNLRTL